MTTAIVGTNFRGPAALVALQQMSSGTKLALIREPKNRYDRNAIAVFRASLHLGYLSRGVAVTFAKMMDMGTEIAVTKIEPEGTGLVELTWGKDIGSKPAALPDGSAFRLRKPDAAPPRPPKLPKLGAVPEKRVSFPEIDLDAAPLPDPWD